MSARQAAEEAGRSGTQAAKASSLTGMSLTEAKQILNIQDLEDLDTIRKVTTSVVEYRLGDGLYYLQNYEHLYKINAKSSGGSFYLQSKVFRACERVEMELDTSISKATKPPSEDNT